MLLLATAPALALDQPPRLEGQVTDQAGVLTPADEAKVAAALEQLRNDTEVQLFTAYVDTTGGEDVNSFTEATAAASSLGGNDALILVAIEDRSYSMWVGPSLDEITDAEIDAILTESLEPALVDGEFAAAMISAASATGMAVRTDTVATPAAATPVAPAPTAGAGSEGSGSGSTGGGLSLTPILAILLVAGGLFLVGRALLPTSRDCEGASRGPGHAQPRRQPGAPRGRRGAQGRRQRRGVRRCAMGRPGGHPVPRGHPPR